MNHSIARPTDTHPNWCSRHLCSDDVVHGQAVDRYHRSEPSTWRTDAGQWVEFGISQAECLDGTHPSGAPKGYLVLEGDFEVGVSDLEALGSHIAGWVDALKGAVER